MKTKKLKIVKRSAKILGIKISPDGAMEISKRARKTPRIANRLLKECVIMLKVKAQGVIDQDVAQKALDMLK